jgi:hypothetical protein
MFTKMYAAFRRPAISVFRKEEKVLEIEDNPANEVSSRRLYQDFSNCGMRTTSGRPATVQWYTVLVRKIKG